MEKKLTIYAIETNEGVYVSLAPTSSYDSEKIRKYSFDGIVPKFTFTKEWFKINNPPKKITHIQYQPNINHRFELLDESLASDKIPKVIPKGEAGETIDYEFYWNPTYSMYKSLYEEKSDEQPPIEVDDEFDYIVLSRIDSVKEPQQISYPYKETGVYGHDGDITNEKIEHSILDRIVYPTLTLHERPCRLSSKQSYNIIREFIKTNINPKVAMITSDYDFCFTVEKIIPLAEPYQVEYDANRTLFGRKRKPNIKTRWINDKKIVCFEMTSAEDNYKGYTPIKPFEGTNEDNLKENIDSYLKELIDYINEPLIECEHCKGKGVLLNSKVEYPSR